MSGGKICDGCGLPPRDGKQLRRCTRCRSVWYHDVSCQMRHFPKHKKECISIAESTKRRVEVNKDSNGANGRGTNTIGGDDIFRSEVIQGKGRCMLANRPIKPGCRIGHEPLKPLVSPVLTERCRAVRCANCFCNISWGLNKETAILHRFCSKKCQDAAQHMVEEECIVKSLGNSMPGSSRAWKPRISPTALLLYRILRSVTVKLPAANSCGADDTRHALKVLKSNLDASTEEEKLQFLQVARTACFLVQKSPWYRGNSIPSSATIMNPEYLADVLSKIVTNAFTVCDGEGSALGLGLYPDAAVMNHSCEPNVFQAFLYGKHVAPGLVLTTCSDVQKGEELCISYIDHSAPRDRRQESLSNGYKFECTCKKCENDCDDNLAVGLRCPRFHCNGLACHNPGKDNHVVCEECGCEAPGTIIAQVKELFSVIECLNTGYSRFDELRTETGPVETEVSRVLAAYNSLKGLCSLRSWYVQEAGEAVIQSVLDSISLSEDDTMKRQKCAKVLSVLDELSMGGEHLSPVSALLRRYKGAKIKLYLFPDPRPALVEMQEVHKELLAYFPRSHELITGLEACMKSALV